MHGGKLTASAPIQERCMNGAQTQIVPPPRRKYPSVGRCIYCGTKDGPLTLEHIVPEGLGGRHEFIGASCGACAAITRDFEETCLRRMFGNARVRLDYPSKRKKQRPARLTVRTRVAGRTELLSLAVADVPDAIVLVPFDEARILRGDHTDRREFIAGVPWVYGVGIDPARHTALGIKGLTTPIHLHNLSRMRAKIAHGYAIAELGYGTFKELLPDLILGRTPNSPYLVGGSLVPDPPRTALYELSHRWERSQDDQDYLVISIRLFAHLGAPTFSVVAGRALTS